MRLIRFSADSVHNYLNLDISFNPQVTFLIGLNGCGKTTAINLITALITPAVRNLIETPYKYAELVFEVNGGESRMIRSEKKDSIFRLTLTGVDDPLVIDLSRLESVGEDTEMAIELMKTFEQQAISSSAYGAIIKLPSPMVLGIDRRMGLDDGTKLYSDHRRRLLSRNRGIRLNVSESLDDVQILIRDAMLEIREEQGKLDEILRKKIILDAFSHAPTKFAAIATPPPDSATIRSFRDKLELISRSTTGLGVPVADLEERLKDFLERLEALTEPVTNLLSRHKIF